MENLWQWLTDQTSVKQSNVNMWKYSRRLNQDKIILFSQTSFDPTERPPKIDRVHKLHHWVAFLQCLQKEPKVKRKGENSA